ncbi:Nucleolar protein 58, partial [Coemansia asiatica]
AGPKAKGKIARLTATKASIAVRVDALGDSDVAEVGIDGRVKVEARLRQLEGRFAAKAARADRGKTNLQNQRKFEKKEITSYNAAADVVMTSVPVTPVVATSSEKKRKADSDDEDDNASGSDSESDEEKKDKKDKDKKDKSEKKEKKDKDEKKEKKSKKNKD